MNTLTLILLTWRIWWASNDASRWQMGFNSAFKGLSPTTHNMLDGGHPLTFFLSRLESPSGPRPHFWGSLITFWHTMLNSTSLDEWSAHNRDLCLLTLTSAEVKNVWSSACTIWVGLYPLFFSVLLHLTYLFTGLRKSLWKGKEVAGKR